jgi:hypothetical protein
MDKKSVNLISTIERKSINGLQQNTPTLSYIVKETKFNLINNEILEETESLFSKDELYKNKVDARLFYDARINCIEEMIINQKADEGLKLELFLIIEKDNSQEKLLLASSMIGEDYANKKRESLLFNSLVNNNPNKLLNEANNICTINTFLDSNYKD